MTELPTPEAPAGGPKDTKKALVIDDYYGRPKGSEVRSYTNSLRQFITDHPDSGLKEWLDENFGLSGDYRRGDYFDAFLEDPSAVRTFWNMRDQSPIGDRLSKEVLGDLVALLEPAQHVLRNIEKQLVGAGWDVVPAPSLPTVESVADDIGLIAIDYILVPGEAAAQGLERSMEFLRKVLEQSRTSAAESCPFVLLMSENPQAERDAERFRREVRIHSPYFRFAKKEQLTAQEVNRIAEGFLGQRGELESYRKLHYELEKAISLATDNLRKSVADLELQDLATFHAGQLVQEGELLSDYVSWLYGQSLATELVQHAQLADRAANLPTASYRVLLGHLSATDNIPALFSSVSLAVPASAARHKAVTGTRQLRFGDLFAYKGEPPPPDAESVDDTAAAQPKAAADPAKPLVERYLLVISQTCDLLHGNIKNGQALCLDGDAQTLMRTESDLLRATIRQMDQQGRVLHRQGGKYVEVEWRPKDLRTVDAAKLETENGFRYVGRLNEVYALQAQHNALDHLGRIGVPIQPGYSTYFDKLEVKVYEGVEELKELEASSKTDMILAVLRAEKPPAQAGGPPKGRHRLLLSDDVRVWLIERMNALSGMPGLPNQLGPHVNRLKSDLEQRPNFSLIVKVRKDGVAEYSLEALKADGSLDPEGKLRDLGNTVAVRLDGVFDSPQRSNPRLELIFRRVRT